MRAMVAAGLVVLLIPVTTLAACNEVEDIASVPDGATASREEMMAAQKAVANYSVAVDEFVECLRSNGGNLGRENRAIDKLTKVANKFNGELRTFKKRGT